MPLLFVPGVPCDHSHRRNHLDVPKRLCGVLLVFFFVFACFGVPRVLSRRCFRLGTSQRLCPPGVRVEGTPHWGLFSSFLWLAADPETVAIGEFSLRVTLGVDSVLPSMPAFYVRKVRCRGEILDEPERNTAFTRER